MPKYKASENVCHEIGKLKSYQICNNGFNLALYYLYIFGGTLQRDLVLSLGEFNVHLLINRALSY